MTTFHVLARDYTTPLTLPDIDFQVRRYSQTAQGGPDLAQVVGQGPEQGLWEMAEWLGSPCEVYDDQYRKVWWGRLNEMVIAMGRWRIGLRIQDVANRVAVAYSYVEPGSTGYGMRATTAWAEDTDSVSAYGKKEVLVTLSSATHKQAEATRDAVLEALRLPVPSVDIGQEGGRGSAEFTCRGHFNDLDTVYYAENAGKETYEESGASVPLGNGSANQRVAMGFQVTSSAGWEAAMIKARARKVGTPADTIRVELCADAGGAPGASLTLEDLTDPVPDNMDWVSFTLEYLATGGFVDLTPGVPYWLVFSRTGGLNGTNYYELGAGQLTYPGGALRVWNGSTWSAVGGTPALDFQVLGGKETTRQIADIVERAGAGILTGTVIENRSNVISNQYRRGDNTAMYEILELLKSGPNGRRLLATVTQNRELLVWEEPARVAANAVIYLANDGRVLDQWDNPVAIQSCPVGVWAMLRNALPSSLDMNRMADPSLIFIEQAEYDVEARSYLPRPRGAQTVWDITTRISEG